MLRIIDFSSFCKGNKNPCRCISVVVPCPCYRYITILSENSEEATSLGQLEDEKDESGLDLRTLRAIRVLRPLKLVSGVPSKSCCIIIIIVSLVSSI